MNEKVKPNLLLEADDEFYLLFDELIILSISDLALVVPGTSVTDLLGLLLGSRKKEVMPVGEDKILTGKEPMVVVGNLGSSSFLA